MLLAHSLLPIAPADGVAATLWIFPVL